MSRHHWMYLGCQCSSARSSRLLLDRLTLFGIFSAEIMIECSLRPFPIELGPTLLSVRLKRAFRAHRVGALKNPVLPGREPSEDFGFHRFGTGEAQIRLEAGHRIGREGCARLDGHPN